MAFDYKKEFKEFYQPPKKPTLVDVPTMNFIAVRGAGDPNQEDGVYKAAIGKLYAVAFTIKMSYKGNRSIEGYFPYVVPPLEGFWWQDSCGALDYAHKEDFRWISVIRLPDFVSRNDFNWAVEEATRKKNLDLSQVEFFTYNEGLCVQCMHIGSYDNEPATVAAMAAFAETEGYAIDITEERLHHEIYLSDPRRCAEDKLRTIIRHPVRKI